MADFNATYGPPATVARITTFLQAASYPVLVYGFDNNCAGGQGVRKAYKALDDTYGFQIGIDHIQGSCN